jgi:Arc/MetJ-type ribon-helix-helix transcriptional regulator
MTKLTIRLPEKLKSDVDNLCREEQRAVSDVVRELLLRYVSFKKLRSVRDKILPCAEAQGLLSDEDIFRTLLEDSRSACEIDTVKAKTLDRIFDAGGDVFRYLDLAGAKRIKQSQPKPARPAKAKQPRRTRGHYAE